MKTSLLRCVAVLIAFASPGCLIDDTGQPRGQASGPSASVPDSGSPVRRESAAETLNDADREPAPAKGDTLEVQPAPGRTPPPPVQ